MSFQTIEMKKEAFKRFLDENGLVDQLTRVLISLYEEPEKPVNAVEYLKKNMGAPSNIDGEKLRFEHDKLVDENIRLNMQIKNIKREISIYKPQEQNNE